MSNNNPELYLQQRDTAHKMYQKLFGDYVGSIEIIHEALKEWDARGYNRGYEQGYKDALKINNNKKRTT